MGADGPLEVVDERVHLLIRLRPAEFALLVLDVAVERRDRRIDQPGHPKPPPALVAERESALIQASRRAVIPVGPMPCSCAISDSGPAPTAPGACTRHGQGRVVPGRRACGSRCHPGWAIGFSRSLVGDRPSVLRPRSGTELIDYAARGQRPMRGSFFVRSRSTRVRQRSMNGSIPTAGGQEQVLRNENPVSGDFCKPSDGLEPSTPPCHGGSGAVLADTAGHSRACFSCNSGLHAVVCRARACPRVLDLMYPSRTRVALSVQNTD